MPTLETRSLRIAGTHRRIDWEAGMGRGIVFASILALGSFTWAVNFGLLVPLIKLIGAEFDKSDTAVGQLATVHSAATGIAALLIAPWLDHFRRGTLLRVGVALMFAGAAFTTIAPAFAWLFPARLLSGVGAAFVMPVLFALAAELFGDTRQRNQAVGLVIAATSLAPLVGIPLLTQIASAAGWRWAAASLLAPLLVVGVNTL
jgi:predicted MFS family arabinose efflux permease